MRTTTLRLGLSLMVVISLWTGRLAAQQVYVVPTVPYDIDHHPNSPPPFSAQPKPEPAKHLYKRVLNHFNMGCQANPWGFGGNFHSEASWMFGSSRAWFLEPCVPTLPCAERREQR